MDPHKATADKVRRFKNEINFCYRFKNPHIIPVYDFGLFRGGKLSSRFYVMPLYKCSLRNLIEDGIPPERILPYFDQMLSGVEAAHLKGVIHRDIKPENILFDETNDCLLIGDFGIAHFEEEDLFTAIMTRDSDRLANFQYASPEQRARGQLVDHRADIYALGLILNEMFTKKIPQGTEYLTIESIQPDFQYLDKLLNPA